MNLKIIFGIVLAMSLTFSCKNESKTDHDSTVGTVDAHKDAMAFNYNVEQFADVKILRYQIPGWDNLTLKEQKLVYYLTQAGLAGRDMMWDQNYRYNLKIRKALEYQKRMSWIAKADKEQNVVQTLNKILSSVGLSYLDLNTKRCCWHFYI